MGLNKRGLKIDVNNVHLSYAIISFIYYTNTHTKERPKSYVGPISPYFFHNNQFL